MKSKILCVTDLDGTFIKDSVQVSQNDLLAYHYLLNFSDFSIATGRSVKEIHYVTDQNAINCQHFIAFNGALIINSDQETIFSDAIPQMQVAELLDYLKKEQLVFDALDGERRIGNFSHEHPERLWNMEIICPDNLYDILIKRELFKFNVRPPKDTAGSCLSYLQKKFPNLEIYHSGATRIEITAKGVSKGAALQKIASSYDLVIAFGDSGNDISLFDNADISYCMSEAAADVQQHATFTVNHFSDAIAHLSQNIGNYLNH
ncbi:HAD-IIB family hydrolase [Streptococcus pantholopis]|uniref:Haloacid dehalogenase n=1 Tax=Streptococcus pantholopis TaxID=1811193 RepID=A0A172Q679_9STRE|nr:HAD-IIB family hydrolase [Streptococcus pantholopis]AND78917.1 haloacid dehalogenase [Streptococcus pantholopis]